MKVSSARAGAPGWRAPTGLALLSGKWRVGAESGKKRIETAPWVRHWANTNVTFDTTIQNKYYKPYIFAPLIFYTACINNHKIFQNIYNAV